MYEKNSEMNNPSYNFNEFCINSFCSRQTCETHLETKAVKEKEEDGIIISGFRHRRRKKSSNCFTLLRGKMENVWKATHMPEKYNMLYDIQSLS
jgi:hypothetical protein